MNWKFVHLGVAILGLLVLVAGCVIIGVSNTIVESLVKKETQLKNGTDIYEKWSELPIPVYMKFSLFNITNYEEYQGIDDWNFKPVVKEVGPFVYREKRQKDFIQSHTHRDTVSYMPKITYTFEPEMSNGYTENDLIYTINTPFFSLAGRLSQLQQKQPDAPIGLIVAMMIEDSILGKGERLVKLLPAKDVIWGWELSPLLKLVTGIGANLGLHFPPELQHGMFGYYLDKNGRNADGLWEVYSGIEDTAKFNQLRTVDGRTANVDWWGDSACANIRGNDGTMFAPFIKEDTKLYVYSAEICRSIWLDFLEKTNYEGIPGYRFHISDDVFKTPTQYPDNKCYCLTIDGPMLDDQCAAQGVAKIWPCKSGSPIILSKPHFLDAQASIRNYVDGLTPNYDKHETTIDVEPNTGLTMRANKRIQISVEVQPLVPTREDGTAIWPKNLWTTIPHAMIPAIWIDEEAALTEELVEEVKDKVVKPLRLLKIAKWTMVGVGAALLVFGFGFFMYLRNK